MIPYMTPYPAQPNYFDADSATGEVWGRSSGAQMRYPEVDRDHVHRREGNT